MQLGAGCPGSTALAWHLLPVTTNTAAAPTTKTPPGSKDEQDPAKDALSHPALVLELCQTQSEATKSWLVSENLQASEIALGK